MIGRSKYGGNTAGVALNDRKISLLCAWWMVRVPLLSTTSMYFCTVIGLKRKNGMSREELLKVRILVSGRMRVALVQLLSSFRHHSSFSFVCMCDAVLKLSSLSSAPPLCFFPISIGVV
uniref:Uncharacterized protein n=1 Tax=Trypanosoma congolense (strain IL3000) TaxID=1068625 RepID=G0UPU6_TRYCI|nr:hypothetical protein, unlikely [Trypanosoma congolense IL3000]